MSEGDDFIFLRRDDLPITYEWAKEVCRMGQGGQCCRYLSVGVNGWSCEKHGPHAEHLTQRAANGEMHARADNCGGRMCR